MMGLQVLLNDLRSERVGEKTIATVKTLESSCSVAIDVLNDLLLFDKIESSVMKLDISQIPVRSFVTETVKPFFIQVSPIRYFYKNQIHTLK